MRKTERHAIPSPSAGIAADIKAYLDDQPAQEDGGANGHGLSKTPDIGAKAAKGGRRGAVSVSAPATRTRVPTDAQNAFLETINLVLKEYGQAPWEANALGDRRKGEVEITALEDVTAIGPRRIRLMLRIVTPEGAGHVVPLHVGGTLVYTIPYLSVPGDAADEWYIFFMKRWRVEHRGFIFELPHAIAYNGLMGKRLTPIRDPYETAAFHIMQKHFGGDCASSVGASSVHVVGQLTVKGESSLAEIQLYTAMLRYPFRRKRGECEIVRLTWKETRRLMESGDLITDANTVAALYKALPWFRDH